jgi:DNA repair protein RadA/Sms
VAKVKKQFVCSNCGAAYLAWQGKCQQCGEWNTLNEVSAAAGSGAAASFSPKPLKSAQEGSVERIGTAIPEFDLTLGGGIVPASVILLGGDPGVGKSTLALSLALALAHSGRRILYVCAEESPAQIMLRAERLSLPGAEKLFVAAEPSLESLTSHLEQEQYDLVVLDSIQSIRSQEIASAAGSVSQVSYCASVLQQLAKRRQVSMLVIGHVTKEGSLAGPKTLEHLVDVVLYLEGDRFGQFRLLRSTKNRFGRSGETGLFEMQDTGLKGVANPSGALLEPVRDTPGSAVTITMEGTRAMAVEIQVLTSISAFGYPKRSVSGLDLNRLQLLIAVVTKRLGMSLNTQDIYCNVIGGVKIQDPGVDLAIVAAIASAFRNSPIGPKTIFIGEVGLGGEVRPARGTPQRISEAKRLGFDTIVIPRRASTPETKSDRALHLVETIAEAVSSGIPAS